VSQTSTPPSSQSPNQTEVLPSGIVRYTEPKTTGDGTLDPTYWQGLDVQSAGDVNQTLPQPPIAEGTYEHLMTTEGNVDAPTISNLAVTNITSTGATVTWDTSEDGVSRVVYGIAPNDFRDSTPWTGVQATTHSVDLTGLNATTIYYIEARSRDADGNMNGAQTQFTTT
jgi:hypothetical protein